MVARVALGGVGAGAVWPLALAGAWALWAWLVLGSDGKRATAFAGAWARRVSGLMALPPRAARSRFGGSAEPDVGLGDVSEMIDVVRLGLSAGLSFDASLAIYCENRDTALASRMARARLSWQMGVGSREDELLAAAEDLGVRALESFAMAVGRALALGAPLSDTLAAQGRECRAAHRAEVERQIERAPVKLLVPTATLILPALLLSIVGPLLVAGGMI